MAHAKLSGNLAGIQANLAKLHPSVQDALKGQLATEADDLVAAMRRAMAAAYANSGDNGHQRLQDSLRTFPNPHRVISQMILADARDEKGKFIGSNVEAGHLAVDGSHVAPRPAFFPTYRARRKGLRRRISSAARKAVRALFKEA